MVCAYVHACMRTCACVSTSAHGLHNRCLLSLLFISREMLPAVLFRAKSFPQISWDALPLVLASLLAGSVLKNTMSFVGKVSYLKHPLDNTFPPPPLCTHTGTTYLSCLVINIVSIAWSLDLYKHLLPGPYYRLL